MLKFDKIQMVTFDLDGTMIDDEWAHAKAKTEIAREIGAAGDLQLDYYTGRSNRLFWKSVCSQAKKELDIEQLTSRQFHRVLELIRQAKQPESPGLSETMYALKQGGIQIAVTSGSDSFFVDGLLQYLNVEALVDVKVTKNHVRNVKPDPDIYLTAQQMANVLPGTALGIEDSAPGCEALRRAGMVSVGFTNSGRNPQCLDAADFQISEMTQLLPFLKKLNHGVPII